MTVPAPLFALGLVLTVAAASSGDYALIAPGIPPICAKSSETCEAARIAISKGWFLDLPRDTVTVCQPSPGCFDPVSLEIRGRR
jgi:hypothetical protein